METAKIFDKLKDLQDILVEKYKLEAKIEETPKQLNAQEELLARLKKEYIAKNTNYDSIKEKVAELKHELDDAVRSRENGEKGMDNITTHREYEALEKQINEATEKENDIRKDLQKNEKSLEELKESLKSDEDMIKAQESDLLESKKNLDAEVAGYNKKLDQLKKKEDKITPDLDQEILFKFERIIQRNSEGIVAVRNGVCTGCQMNLPAQFANIVREGENINFCPYCSRILFYEETEEDSTETYFKAEDAGSLADLDDDFMDELDDEDQDKKDEFDDESEYYDSDEMNAQDDEDEDSDELEDQDEDSE